MTRDDFILKAMISMASDSQWGLKSDFAFEIKERADEMANAARLLARAAEDVCHIIFDEESESSWAPLAASRGCMPHKI